MSGYWSKVKKLFRTEGKKSVDYSAFYSVAIKRQEVFDSFVDHSLCSVINNCKSYKVYDRALPPQDIKYIYTRSLKLESIFMALLRQIKAEPCQCERCNSNTM